MTQARKNGGPWRWRGVMMAAVVLLPGCTLDSLTKSDELPPNVTDPAITKTPAGALSAYHGAILKFQFAVGGAPQTGGENGFVPVTGLLSDELEQPGGSGITSVDPVNQRSMFQVVNNNSGGRTADVYSRLHQVRGQSDQAIQLLRQYVPEQPALAGHLYAIKAYAEIMLAELFCSGIPLSTIDYDGNYTLRPGSTTEEVLTHALALLDTGLTLAADSARFVNLIHIAQGRALLAQEQYAAAAAAVAEVPDNYQYALSYNSTIGSDGNDPRNFGEDWAALGGLDFSVADSEGVNGLNYRSSGDPRAMTTQVTHTVIGGLTIAYWPNKYDTTGATPIVLASGIEARLIQAEAQLAANDGTWLTTLNALRTDGTYDVTATTPPDTLWHAGTGGVAGLKPLADPGTVDGRVDLIFRERAFWLFLTGHRQGDLRRLVRQYARDPESAYPTGGYPIAGNFYGTDVTAPIPATETASNPLFTGCASTGA